VTNDRVDLHVSGDRSAPTFTHVERDQVVYLPKNPHGFARASQVTTADGQRGWLKGRYAENFDGDGLYCFDFVHKKLRRIPMVSSDSDVRPLSRDKVAILSHHHGVLSIYEWHKHQVTQYFSGVPHSIGNRILKVSPTGRFILFLCGGFSGTEENVRLLDTVNRDVLLLADNSQVPIHFSQNDATILYGPDPMDNNIYFFKPDALIRDMANLRQKHWQKSANPIKAPGKIAVSPNGDRMMVISATNQLTLYQLADRKKILTLDRIGDGHFLPAGTLLLRRPDGWITLTEKGEVLTAPFSSDGINDQIRISPKGGYILFTSTHSEKNRLRRIYDIKRQQMCKITDLHGEFPLIFDPIFMANDTLLLAKGFLINPISGVAYPRDDLKNFIPHHVNTVAEKIFSYDGAGIINLRDVENGKTEVKLPFPKGFSPIFAKEPQLMILQRNY
jgi:hypothetical protein